MLLKTKQNKTQLLLFCPMLLWSLSFVSFFCARRQGRSSVPDQRPNLGPLQWMPGVLTTRPPGKFLRGFFYKSTILIHEGLPSKPNHLPNATLSHWGLGFNRWILRKHKHSVCSKEAFGYKWGKFGVDEIFQGKFSEKEKNKSIYRCLRHRR